MLLILFSAVAAFGPAHVFADTCSSVELKGFVRIEKTDMFLVMAEKTQSQKKFSLLMMIEPKLSPYINHYVKLKAVLNKDEIVGIESVQDDITDPLNQNQNSELKKLKEIKCPSY